MTLRTRSILTVALVSLASVVVFSASLLYVTRSALDVWENPKVARGLEIAVALASEEDPATRAEALQAFRSYHTLQAVKGIINQRVVIAGLGFGALVLVLSLGISSFALMRITRPLKELRSAIDRAATGDLDVRVNAPPGSEVGVVAEAFNAMTARLARLQADLRRSERLAAWRDVARILGHEVRNPLTPIRLSVERLQVKSRRQSPDLPEVLESSTRTILEEIAALDRIVTEFSEFARLPAPRMRDADLKQLIDGVVAQYAPTAPAVRFTVDCGVSRCRLDPDLMRRVFGNIVKNSIEALAGRAGPGHVSVTTARSGKGCRIAFVDDGPGIPPGDRERVMEPYFTTKTKGTGLGLAVARNIIAEHGGTLTVDSPGTGTRVVIDIPEGDAIGHQAAGS